MICATRRRRPPPSWHRRRRQRKGGAHCAQHARPQELRGLVATPDGRDYDPREQLARVTIVRRLEHVGVGVVEEILTTRQLLRGRVP